ncbi:MAG: serine protease, partial [Trueperaceae bacterium]|nr:serine protease [Trueperaceae bacterium]
LQIITDAQGNPLPADHRFTFAPIGTIENLLLGDSVFIIGFPGVSGNTITFTGGVVSGFLGPDTVGSGNAWVKTDARMAPGNSGGGAFDAAGTLIGVPTMLLRDSLAGLQQELFRPINYAYAMISQHVPAPALQVGTRPPQQPPATPSEVAKGAADVIRGSLGLADPPYFAERRAHAFHVSIQQPGLVSISLKSADFDAYLVLLAPSGSVLLEVDDSLGVGPNVAEDVRIDVPGTYMIIVTTTLPHEAGAYALTVTSPDGAGPLSVTATNLPRENVGGYAPTYAGRWSGRIIDTAGGRGAVVAELTQTGAAIVEGTWEATFTWGTTSGTIMGLIQSEGLFVELYPHDRTACPFNGLAELDGYTIAGAYTAFDCTIPIAGSISLTQRP